jgi:hypothetical protein
MWWELVCVERRSQSRAHRPLPICTRPSLTISLRRKSWHAACRMTRPPAGAGTWRLPRHAPLIVFMHFSLCSCRSHTALSATPMDGAADADWEHDQHVTDHTERPRESAWSSHIPSHIPETDEDKSSAHLRQLFGRIDADGNGLIDEHELALALMTYKRCDCVKKMCVLFH